MYVNGVLEDTDSLTAVTGSLTNTAKLTLGSRNGALLSSETLAFAAMWKGASWLSTADQAAFAKERFQILSGLYPQIAAGSTTPTTMERDDVSEIVIHDGTYLQTYQVGPNWLPFCKRNIGGTDIQGYSPQPQITNLIDESQAFSTWATVYPDTVLDDQALGPDGEISMSSFRASATNGYHSLAIDVSLTSGTVYTFSLTVAPGDRDWVYIKDNNQGTAAAFFNVANGTIGTVYSGASASIEGAYVGNGYRISITYTASSTGTHNLRIYPCDSDGDSQIAGSGSVNLYYYGAQMEAYHRTTPLFRTSGATATRVADELVFEAGANIGGASNAKGQIVQTEWLPIFEPSQSTYNAIISDGGATTDAIALLRDSTNFYRTQGITAKTAGNAGAVVGPSLSTPNNTIHTTTFAWTANDLRIYDGTTAGTTDTSADMPVNLDEMAIGQDESGANQHGGIIAKHSVFDDPGYTPSALDEIYSTTTISGNFDSHILQFNIDSSGNVTMSIDGNVLSVSGAGTLTIRKLDGAGYVGCELRTNAADSLINFFEGHIGEILVWAENLNSDDSAAILAYLQEKWNLS
jgi:hypothetical protein